ncbi:hypothetical protein GINT2_000092 [Glugoides intestinalis]
MTISRAPLSSTREYGFKPPSKPILEFKVRDNDLKGDSEYALKDVSKDNVLAINKDEVGPTYKTMLDQLKNSNEYIKLSKKLLMEKLDILYTNWESIELTKIGISFFLNSISIPVYKSSFESEEHNLQRIAFIKTFLNLKDDASSPFSTRAFFESNIKEIFNLEKSSIYETLNAFLCLKYLHLITDKIYKDENENLVELLSGKIASLSTNNENSLFLEELKPSFLEVAQRLKRADPGVLETHKFKELFTIADKHFTIKTIKKITEIGTELSRGAGAPFSKVPAFSRPDDISLENYCTSLHKYLLDSINEINTIASNLEELLNGLKL